MSDILEQSDATPGGIDRRSALKKAAVAGAVAWTAPTILSSKATAGDGFCTPKCDPETAPAVVEGCAYCYDKNSKIPKITLGTEGEGDCGACGGTSTVKFSIAAPFLFQKDAKGPSSYIGTLRVAGGNELLVAQSNFSTLGQGTYTSTSGGLVVTSECVDRNGDKVVLACTYGISFDYQPRDGSCTQEDALGNVPGCTPDTGVIDNFGYTLLSTCVRTCNGVSQPL